MTVAVHQARRRIEKIKEAGRFILEMKWRQHAEGNLLVTVPQASVHSAIDVRRQQLEPDAADLAGRTLCQVEAVELGRSYEGFRRDANC